MGIPSDRLATGHTYAFRMSDPGRSWLDHASALVVTFLLAGYGLIGIAAWLAPEPENAIHDGASGLVIFPIFASLYAAAAVLQSEYGIVRGWRPGWRQGAAVTWVGVFSAVVVIGLVRQFASGGIAAARDFIGGAAFFWCLFVGLPWLIAFFRKAARREEYRGFIDE